MLAIEDACRKVVEECMALGSDERFLVMYDQNKEELAGALLEAAQAITEKADSYRVPVGSRNGEEPPAEAAKKLLGYDASVIITSVSLSHTAARRQASQQGVRISTMPNVTEEILMRTMHADYREIEERSARIGEVLNNGRWVHIRTAQGTDIAFSIEGRKTLGAGGILDKPGAFGNLPAGEACLAPLEGTANGIFVIDASVMGEQVTEPIQVVVKEGYAIEIQGGSLGRRLQEHLSQVGRDAFNIAELGIGTNPAATITGNTLEDEKVAGTAHVALGNSISFGGKVDVGVHLDGVFYKPTIYVDETLLMQEGELVL